MMRKRMKNIGALIVLCGISVISLLPFYLMVIMGTHSHSEISTSLQLFVGKHFIDNLKKVWEAGFLRFYFNSFYIAVISAGLAVLFSTLAGFAIAKYEFKGKQFFFNAILATMMIPFGVSIVGFLTEMNALGLSQTHVPIIISTMCSSYGVYMMVQFMKDGIPMEVMESARIDGASEPRIFFNIALPYIKPAALTLFVLLFMNSWNNFMVPLIFINKQKMFTVPLGIFTLGNQYSQEYGARMLALAVATIPTLLIYIFNSKHMEKGMTLGAVKG